MARTAMQNSVAAMAPGASVAAGAVLRGWTVLLAGAALLMSPSIRAAEVTFVPRVSLTETWTDNVGLDPSGEEESDWITELRPGFSLGADGSRASAQFDYDLQALWYADRSERDDVYHQARGTGNVVLVPESLFIDGFARYDQRNIDPAGRVDFGNLFDTDNRTDVLVFGASPYHVGRWGSWAESLVRYDYRGVRNFNTDDTSTNVQDSDGQTITAELNRPEGARGFTWGGSGLYTRTEFDDDNDPSQESEFEYAQAAVNLGVPVSLKTRLTGTVGRETDVSEDSTKGGLDTDFWYVGFAWNPDLLQSLEARVGERYFGRSWGGTYTRRAARGSVELDYSENPTTSAGVLSDGVGLPPGVRPGSDPTLDTRVFLQKRFTGTASYELVRSRISVQLYSAERTFEDEQGGSEDTFGSLVRYDWDIAPRTTLGASVRWERRDFGDVEGSDDLGDFELRARRELTRTLSGELRASHFFRNSDVRDDYDANTISLSVSAVF